MSDDIEPDLTMLDDKLVCPECGKDDLTDNRHLGVHRKTAHGVPGRTSRHSNEARNTRRRRRVVNGVTPDDILVSVLEVLYPNGTMPVKDVVAFLDWRESTTDLLKRVHQEGK